MKSDSAVAFDKEEKGMIRVEDLTVLQLGTQGDDQLPVIDIDVSSLKAKWPNATFDVLIRRPGQAEADAYAASTALTGNVLKWTVAAADVSKPGYGYAQVAATYGTGHWYGPWFSIEVRANLGGGTASSTKPWVSEVLEAKNTVVTNAATATTKAAAASASATAAAGSATAASGSATSAATSASTASTKAGEASASATSASTSAATASTKAGEASASATSAARSATTATTKATAAAASAAAAAASEAAAEAIADGMDNVVIDNNLAMSDVASVESITSKYEMHNGCLSASGTWANVNENYRHVVIPVRTGDTFSYHVSSDSPRGCYYAGLTEYTEPTTSGETITGMSQDLPFRSVVPGSKTGNKTIPSGVKYLCLSIYNNGSLATFKSFRVTSAYVGRIQHQIGTVYVSGEGDDVNGDGSQDSPYRSIQRAVDSGQQVVCVKPGTIENGVYTSYSYDPFVVTDRRNPLTINMYDVPEYTYIHGDTVTTAGTRVQPKILIDKTGTSSTGWNGVSIKKSNSPVVLNDIEVTGEGLTYAARTAEIRHCFNFENCAQVDVNRCIAHHNTTEGYSGYHYANASGVLRDCVAHDVTMDGFNFHIGGNTQMINCKSYDNGDDGVSHHDGCTGVIIGGEYYNNTKGGISSPYGGSIIDIIDAYSHDNQQYGVYSAGPSPRAAGDGVESVYARPRNQLRMSNCVLKNNSTKDIYLAQCDAVGWGNTYDSKTVNQQSGTGKMATFTEYQSAVVDVGTLSDWTSYKGGGT